MIIDVKDGRLFEGHAITIVLPYYENGGMLDRHLAEWASYPAHVREQFRAVIVDDGSTQSSAFVHLAGANIIFPIELYRIKQNIPWNIPGARNLGMKMAPDGWCLLTDIDHVLLREDAESLAGLFKDVGKLTDIFYTMQRRWADGRPLHPHPNSYILQRSLYWQTGGTDEDFSGWWGAGESAFRKSLMTCAQPHELKSVYLTHFGRDDIPDASTREWGRKGSAVDYNNNPALVSKARGPAYKAERPIRFEWERVI
jgi:hypothetical protein